MLQRASHGNLGVVTILRLVALLLFADVQDIEAGRFRSGDDDIDAFIPRDISALLDRSNATLEAVRDTRLYRSHLSGVRADKPPLAPTDYAPVEPHSKHFSKTNTKLLQVAKAPGTMSSNDFDILSASAPALKDLMFRPLCVVAAVLFFQAWIYKSSVAKVSKEGLLTIGIITTALMGGGIIFGFSAFAELLIEMPNSPFDTNSISSVFAIGHHIMVLGCVVGGFALDYMGPRAFAISGFAIEAIGHLLLMHADRLPQSVTMCSYGLIGWGGCQIFLVALSFVNAFERCNLIASVLTSLFQMGGFVFMALPFVGWKPFFFVYTVLCLIGGCVAAAVYPSRMLHASPETSPETTQEAVATNELSLRQVLCQERVLWFLFSFTVCGSALIYGIGEVPAALRAKDKCQWDEIGGDFTKCEDQVTQDHLNYVVMPFVGNFIVPCSLLLGNMIDRWGFAIPAFINVFSVQAFMGALHQCNLTGQYVTALLFNIANSTVFTVQNAYICTLGSEHVGRLFAISNVLLGLGNFVSDWLNTNPFGNNQNRVSSSLSMSCTIWFIVTCPAYLWVLAEVRANKKQLK